MAFQETTWLDYIPGARTAYNYLVSKVVAFYLVGTQKIPAWERTTAVLAPKIQQSGDTTLKARLTAVTKQTVDLKGGWTSLETRVTDMISKLRAVGLGDGEGLGVAVAIPVALAVALITLVGGLYIFFGATSKNEAAVRDLVNHAVKAGIITTQEASRLLREGGVGGGLSSLGGGLGLLAIAAAAIYFIPRRKRAS
jgi:hypothetical protein